MGRSRALRAWRGAMGNGVGLAGRLVPDWPLTSRPELLADHREPKPVARLEGGFEFGYASLLACAWGRPSEAFGPLGRPFDGTRHIARLPGPPYLFMSRVASVSAGPSLMRSGVVAEVEYDVPPDAWYFDQTPHQTMPFAVLLEAALQPCGWLAVYSGAPATSEEDLYFRNLDGTGTIHRSVGRDAGVLRTRTTLTNVAQIGAMILVKFEVVCSVAGEPVYTLETGFGFFPPDALAEQVGMGVSADMRARRERDSDFMVDLRERPPAYCQGRLAMPDAMLLMLDRVTGWWPEGGEAGLGQLRGEKLVDPDEWFFKAHFHGDPVQPGSLGIEAMIQLLQFYMLHTQMDVGLPNPRFEAIETQGDMTWSYRGQVVPSSERILVEIEITHAGSDERGALAVATAHLWVDDLCIYTAHELGLRIVSDPREPETETETEHDILERFDPAEQSWLADHRPTYAAPVVPLMVLVDRLAAAARHASGREVVGLTDLRIEGWLSVERPRQTRVRVLDAGRGSLRVRLECHEPGRGSLPPRWLPQAEAQVLVADHFGPAPERLDPLTDAEPGADPYASGALFHGPAFALLRTLQRGRAGASATLDAAAGSVPLGLLHPALLDASLHAIPHDTLGDWAPEIPSSSTAFPYAIPSMTIHGPTPTRGTIEVEVRMLGVEAVAEGPPRFVRFAVQLLAAGRVWAAFEIVEVLVHTGVAGRDRSARLAFIRDRHFVPGFGLSSLSEGKAVTELDELHAMDWLPGSVAAVYATKSSEAADQLAEIAMKDLVAQATSLHPEQLSADPNTATLRSPRLPYTRFEVELDRSPERVVAHSAHEALVLDPALARDRALNLEQAWLGRDVPRALCRRFVRRVHLEDPEGFARLAGRPCLWLANHQVQVESLLFPWLASALAELRIVTIAKAEHREGWVGPLVEMPGRRPGITAAADIVYFDQRDPASMFALLEELGTGIAAGDHGLFLHVEGELGLVAGAPVQRLSSVFIDLALTHRLPIIPVRFCGGLPVEALDSSIDFPLAYGRQDYWIGAALEIADIEALALAQRREQILNAINSLGGPALGRPLAGDAAFASAVSTWREAGLREAYAVVAAALTELADPSAETTQLLELVALRLRDGAREPHEPAGEVEAWLRGAADLLMA